MKKVINTIGLFLLLTSMNSFAQTSNEKFQQAVLKGRELLKNAKGTEDFAKSANYFERVAQVESKEWLAPYYAAYSNLVAGLTSSDNAVKDQYWDKALIEVDQAAALSNNNSEIYALKGYIQYMKLSVDPQNRLSFMTESAGSLATAKSLNPENPRIYLIMGQNTFYTPEAFGGGKEKAKPILEAAAAKFAIFKPANELEPSWGAERTSELLAQCK
ncbi:MAG: hypothetical protein JWQ28_2018 [Pedobacter sp.]|jgi:hypothetical protein|nr:hypothetical protein [Pedobacter sp.]